jgi:hypothetical protein
MSCSKLTLIVLTATGFLDSASLGVAQTRVHRDLGGVSMNVGRVNLSVRLDGRVTTSVPVGRIWAHQSNYGFGGLTYDSPVGRFDSLYNNQRQQTFAWYKAYPKTRVNNRVDWKLNRLRPPPWQPSPRPYHQPMPTVIAPRPPR